MGSCHLFGEQVRVKGRTSVPVAARGSGGYGLGWPRSPRIPTWHNSGHAGQPRDRRAATQGGRGIAPRRTRPPTPVSADGRTTGPTTTPTFSLLDGTVGVVARGGLVGLSGKRCNAGPRIVQAAAASSISSCTRAVVRCSALGADCVKATSSRDPTDCVPGDELQSARLVAFGPQIEPVNRWTFSGSG